MTRRKAGSSRRKKRRPVACGEEMEQIHLRCRPRHHLLLLFRRQWRRRHLAPPRALVPPPPTTTTTTPTPTTQTQKRTPRSPRSCSSRRSLGSSECDHSGPGCSPWRSRPAARSRSPALSFTGGGRGGGGGGEGVPPSSRRPLRPAQGGGDGCGVALSRWPSAWGLLRPATPWWPEGGSSRR